MPKRERLRSAVLRRLGDDQFLDRRASSLAIVVDRNIQTIARMRNETDGGRSFNGIVRTESPFSREHDIRLPACDLVRFLDRLKARSAPQTPFDPFPVWSADSRRLFSGDFPLDLCFLSQNRHTVVGDHCEDLDLQNNRI